MSDHDANSNNGSTDSSNDSLNGSWVKLDASFKNGSEHPISVHNGEMEDLLAEAVVERESSLPSTPSEVEASEISSESKVQVLPPEHLSSDRSWIEDWSSRVEPHPPKKWQLTYPPRRDPTPCVGKIQADKSNTNFIKLNFYIVVPTLLVTHIIAFGIGFLEGLSLVDKFILMDKFIWHQPNLYLGRRSASATTSV